MAYKYIKNSQTSLEPIKSKLKTKVCNHTPFGIAKIKNMDTLFARIRASRAFMHCQ